MKKTSGVKPRLFRLFNEETLRDEPRRYYLTEQRAIERALLFIWHSPIRTAVTVHNLDGERFIGTFFSYMHGEEKRIGFVTRDKYVGPRSVK